MTFGGPHVLCCASDRRSILYMTFTRSLSCNTSGRGGSPSPCERTTHSNASVFGLSGLTHPRLSSSLSRLNHHLVSGERPADILPPVSSED